MTEKGKIEQPVEACVSEHQEDEVVNDSNVDLSSADPSPPEAGPDEVLTAEFKVIAMRTDAPCLATAQASQQSTGASIGSFECGKHLAATDAIYDDIPIPSGPQNVLSTSDGTAAQRKLEHVDNRWPMVIKGVIGVLSQNAIEARSPVRLLEVPCHQRPVLCKVHISNDIIPRAA